MHVLYVQTQGTQLRLEQDCVKVVVEGQARLRVPLLRLQGLVVFGRVIVTPQLIHRCGADGRGLVWMSRGGRFLARLCGATGGNVLLRRAQHEALSDQALSAVIARQMVAAKIQNCRQVVLRGAREALTSEDRSVLGEASERLAGSLVRLGEETDLQVVRGIEGEAARAYFGAFGHLVRVDRDEMSPAGRTRRPPRDRMNCLLSFLYALVRSECEAALEAIGLDPQVGYLHALRPGRPALALDLMEEFRPVLADRLALSLVNRRQVGRGDFEEQPGGGWRLTDKGRKTVVVAYQERKERRVVHRVLDRQVPLGLIAHVQARLLARYLRKDIRHYPPFLYR